MDTQSSNFPFIAVTLTEAKEIVGMDSQLTFDSELSLNVYGVMFWHADNTYAFQPIVNKQGDYLLKE